MNTKKVEAKNVGLETVKTKNPKDDIAAANPVSLGSLEQENALSLDDHVLFELDGDNEIIACMAYVNLDGRLIESLEPFEISSGALCKMYSDHVGLRKSNSDILALQIFFGANENKTMHFFYQPICISLKETSRDARLQRQGIFEVHEEKGDIYDYTGTVFQAAASEIHRERYRLTVNIRHRKTETPESFDPTKDVDSVIISFQEIFALLYDNGSDELQIYNAIRRIHDFQGFEIKHSLVMATQGTGHGLKSVVFSFHNRYANLTHLCPPNCNRFIYPLEG